MLDVLDTRGRFSLAKKSEKDGVDEFSQRKLSAFGRVSLGQSGTMALHLFVTMIHLQKIDPSWTIPLTLRTIFN
ncbi:hypothetical protein VJ786_02490 [Sphingobacterium sp. PU5-4]|uniref:Uncharacterized protein n=1 Tax=Sphingobacterium tenebrionis TaxID=3111775 RepID=A0ABU8I2V8_9SPHI